MFSNILNWLAENYLGFSCFAILFTILLVVILYEILKSPFAYPYFVYEIDISGKRKPKNSDLIDNFLNDNANWMLIMNHEKKIHVWKKEQKEYLRTCKLRKRRIRQYQACVDDDGAYQFNIYRFQTRYRQYN